MVDEKTTKPVVLRMLGPDLSDVAAFAKTLSKKPAEVISWDQPPEVHVKCPRPEQVQAMIERYGDSVFAVGNMGLAEVATGLLIASGLTVSVAESCTGGLLAQMISSVPGVSACFKGGVVAYSNDVKSTILGVPTAMIDKYGAVSEEVVRSMASGIRRLTGTDLAVSISGIAGPTGGSDEKPVGTVWIGWEDAAGNGAREFRFSGNREENRHYAAVYALDIIRRETLRMPGR